MAWMIYGAYGYTGRLVVALATERGEIPVLAGRDASKLRPLAEYFALEYRAFDLDDPDAVRQGLEGIDVVAHCAGPFSATAKPMVEACLDTGTNYLDITGEIDVFEYVLGNDARARAAGVTLVPGAGFDVVPSDCLAALLAAELPSATHLVLALRPGGTPSPGTAKTAMESIGEPGRARVDGAIVPVPAHLRRRRVEFPDGAADTTAIAWGDVSTAFHSTGIPNIVVYAALPRAVGLMASIAPLVGGVARRGVTQRVLQRLVGRLPGPSAEVRAKTNAVLWGEVTDSDGNIVRGSVISLNGYDVTADAVVRIAASLERGEIANGALTPSKAFGADFVRVLDKVDVRVPL